MQLLLVGGDCEWEMMSSMMLWMGSGLQLCCKGMYLCIYCIATGRCNSWAVIASVSYPLLWTKSPAVCEVYEKCILLSDACVLCNCSSLLNGDKRAQTGRRMFHLWKRIVYPFLPCRNQAVAQPLESSLSSSTRSTHHNNVKYIQKSHLYDSAVQQTHATRRWLSWLQCMGRRQKLSTTSICLCVIKTVSSIPLPCIVGCILLCTLTGESTQSCTVVSRSNLQQTTARLLTHVQLTTTSCCVRVTGSK